MSEMVERMARALYEYDASNSSVRWESWPENQVRSRKGLRIKCGKYRDRARAALEAMREPTEAMVEASNREWDGRMSHRSSGAWRAMIDASLGVKS